MIVVLKRLTLLAIFFFYGGESVCEKQPCRFTKRVPRTSIQYIDNKLEWFFYHLQSYFLIFCSEDDVKTIRLTSSLGRGRRPRLNRM